MIFFTSSAEVTSDGLTLEIMQSVPLLPDLIISHFVFPEFVFSKS